MMAMLRDHGEVADSKKPGESGPTICVHPELPDRGQHGGALRKDGIIAWCSLVTPCISIFLPFFVDAGVPEVLCKVRRHLRQRPPGGESNGGRLGNRKLGRVVPANS